MRLDSKVWRTELIERISRKAAGSYWESVICAGGLSTTLTLGREQGM